MLKKIGLFILTVIMAFGSAACGTKSPDGEQVLEIFVLDVGYGTQWCNAIIEEFEKQDWVKERYPQLNVLRPQTQTVRTLATSKLGQGSTNTIDLFFDENSSSVASSYVNGEKAVIELTDVLYNSEVPGEGGILYKDKMIPTIRESCRYYTADNLYGDAEYHYAPWYVGMTGIIYNADILKALKLEVPVTTDQWIKSMADIKAKAGKETAYKYSSSLIQSYDAPNYFEYLFPVFWTQYQGMEGYRNFYNGIDNNSLTRDIFGQLGRLYSLEVMEAALDYNKEYLDHRWTGQKFMSSQTDMLQGRAIYHANGDWFDREMAKLRADVKARDGVEYDLQMMRTPVVSKIIERTPNTINTDAKLAEVIKTIDAEEPAPSWADPDEYEIIREARSIVFAMGSYSTAFIPSYATGKNVAVDFLRFMSTDIAHNAYLKATGGASMPFTYDVETKNPALYDSLSGLQKKRLKIFYNENLQPNMLPMPDSLPLSRGGVGAFTYANYFTNFSSIEKTITAKDYFDDTIKYWTTDKWKDAISKARLKPQ